VRAGAFALAAVLLASTASAAEAITRSPADALNDARREGGYGFCDAPSPMTGRQLALCPMAEEVVDCEGLRAACANDAAPPAESRFFEWLARLLAPVAQIVVWAVVVIALLAVAVPVLMALLRGRRRGKRSPGERPSANVATLVAPEGREPEVVRDAEATLALAHALAARGERARALGMYLSAALSALEHRGAVRLARHRTNGEYVRACAEPEAKAPLREIVREVDRIEFGHAEPTDDAVGRVAERAAFIVKRAAVVLTTMAALLVAGCGGLGGGKSDPAGDELPMDVLSRTGVPVAPLRTSLATMPMPDEDGGSTLLLVDLERVTLEDEAEAHLLRWVETGGVLVLLGSPSAWPKALGARPEVASTTELIVDGLLPEPPARLATPSAVSWDGAEAVARLGERPYAAVKRVGRGAVLGVANGELFTNIGASRPANAAALVALVGIAEGEAYAASDREEAPLLHVARAEDGIAPPQNPFAALARAGLGAFAWHALAGALVLFAAYGVRHARPRPAAPRARRAFAEHVVATGAFYARARARSLALAAYGRFVEARLRERLPRGADPAAFLAARSGADEAHAATLVRRALSASPEDEPAGDELATIRELGDLLARSGL
jgi:hypothetical protein